MPTRLTRDLNPRPPAPVACVLSSGVHTGGGGFGGQTSTDDWKKLKTALFGPISLFSYGDCVFLFCIKLPIISRNFHCDAIIPVVKLFWCVVLEPAMARLAQHASLDKVHGH